MNLQQNSGDTGPGVAPRHPRWATIRDQLRHWLPYLVGAAMFAIAIWVLHSALRRYHLADLHAELAEVSTHRLVLAVLFTFFSFAALVGYEWSALGLIGKKMPFRHLALASYTTQSIAHSTGFAFVIGASLRYHFYADRGLGIGDVAKVQMYFTATFTLGVATLAGAVVMIEPFRLADVTGLSPWIWRAGAAAALTLVVAYVVWGGFFHRPFRWRGREFILPDAGATLIQIFFGVADLLAVAAALYVLLPPELELGYIDVLAVFMASIVVGLMSHVPGSLGVFESAVVLLLQPTDAQTLPLIGSLLAFRGIYYLLPLTCGVAVLTLTELHRWRVALARLVDLCRLELGPRTPAIAAALTGVGGLVLLYTAVSRLSGGIVGLAPAGWADAARILEVAGGLALLLLARGLLQRLAVAWQWVCVIFLLAAALTALTGSMVIGGFLLATACLLFACRHEFPRSVVNPAMWQSPAWVVLLALTLASSFWLIGRG